MNIPNPNGRTLPRSIKSNFSRWLLPVLLLSSSLQSIRAGSATWNLNPTSGDWNTAANWMPNTVPNGPADTATFGVSNTTSLSLSAVTEVNSIAYESVASAFTIVASPGFTLNVSGAGIVNGSGIEQQFLLPTDSAGNHGDLAFDNSATAGSQTVFTVNGSQIVGVPAAVLSFFGSSTAGNGAFITNGPTANGLFGGAVKFFNSSTAGNGSFTNNAATIYFLSGETNFFDDSTAGNGTFTNRAPLIRSGNGGSTSFSDRSTAGNATFVNEGGASVPGSNPAATYFYGTSSAGNATVIANGAGGPHGSNALIYFDTGTTAGNATLIANTGTNQGAGGVIGLIGESDGGTARVVLSGNAQLLLNVHNPPNVTLGSVEGEGEVLTGIGLPSLTVGSNNRDATFAGVISGDAGLIKIGSGLLNLTNANLYTGVRGSSGGTNVNAGILLVNNTTGSGTGTGSVLVNAGSLGGGGTITGPTTIGTGSGPGATLAPSLKATKPTILTLQGSLTFKGEGTYSYNLNTKTGQGDQVIARGVTIENGAQFVFAARGDKQLPPGKSLIAIRNTSAHPINGTFANLPDGSSFTVGSNTFQVSYSGGNGNDLSLTIVP